MNLRFCVPQFAGVSGEEGNQHNLHRTGHIQICKQDIAGVLAYRILRSFGRKTQEILF